jgi:hypothetical protein
LVTDLGLNDLRIGLPIYIIEASGVSQRAEGLAGALRVQNILTRVVHNFSGAR